MGKYQVGPTTLYRQPWVRYAGRYLAAHPLPLPAGNSRGRAGENSFPTPLINKTYEITLLPVLHLRKFVGVGGRAKEHHSCH